MLLPPLVLMGVYLLVFHVLWRAANVPHYSLYLLAGLAPWVFFATTVQAGSRAMLDNAPLIRKTRFPRQLVGVRRRRDEPRHLRRDARDPAGALPRVRAGLARHGLDRAAALRALRRASSPELTLALASLNVLFRDVEHLLASLLLPWFFLTPILYSFSQFHHATLTQVLRYANPITPPIEAIRDPLWAGQMPRLGDVIYLVVAAVVALALGAFVFTRVDDRIAVEL